MEVMLVYQLMESYFRKLISIGVPAMESLAIAMEDEYVDVPEDVLYSLLIERLTEAEK